MISKNAIKVSSFLRYITKLVSYHMEDCCCLTHNLILISVGEMVCCTAGISFYIDSSPKLWSEQFWFYLACTASFCVTCEAEFCLETCRYASLYARSLLQKLREDGIYMRPLGNVIYLMCGPCTSPQSCSNLLNKVYTRLEEL